MGLLARREHSQLELRQKLLKRFSDDGGLIDRIIVGLAEEALQSDERFSEAYVRMRYGKGYGPRRILAELRQKGIDDELSAAVVRDGSCDWYESARIALDKKFSGGSLVSADRAKIYRFLTYRGFFHDHIQYAIESQRN
ncbi:MAG: recombination regulator RecX [Cellvibrionaceae bacterium]|nr:recombination regulator RecX [Cellvibrionaceae bacterium]